MTDAAALAALLATARAALRLRLVPTLDQDAADLARSIDHAMTLASRYLEELAAVQPRHAGPDPVVSDQVRAIRAGDLDGEASSWRDCWQAAAELERAKLAADPWPGGAAEGAATVTIEERLPGLTAGDA